MGRTLPIKKKEKTHKKPKKTRKKRASTDPAISRSKIIPRMSCRLQKTVLSLRTSRRRLTRYRQIEYLRPAQLGNNHKALTCQIPLASFAKSFGVKSPQPSWSKQSTAILSSTSIRSRTGNPLSQDRHALVIPKEHGERLHDISEESAADVVLNV